MSGRPSSALDWRWRSSAYGPACTSLQFSSSCPHLITCRFQRLSCSPCAGSMSGCSSVAHDCMHGSLAPGHPSVNRLVGTACVAFYAAFSYSKLFEKHHEHHRHFGHREGPGLQSSAPAQFRSLVSRIFQGTTSRFANSAILTVILIFYIWGLGATIPNVLGFWALPAIGSSLQLFFFGTFLPHRDTGQPLCGPAPGPAVTSTPGCCRF